MNLLFICSKNQWRSPTAERIFQDYPQLSVRSAGTLRSARRWVNTTDIRWADIIFVMENKHKRYLQQPFTNEGTNKRLIVLDIPDDYQYMDDELVAWLIEAVEYQLAL
jgi:predicted protein tyrosine phosphatase